MSKKVLSLVLALVMVLGSFSMVSAAAYNDVAGTAYAAPVDRLSQLGILVGYPDGTFKPEANITRAEFAAVAVRAKGLEAVANAAKGLPTGFTDVPGTHWASGYVGTAGRLGIVNGVGNGLFVPQDNVRYEEAITMLVRALGYEAAAQAKGGYPYGYLIVANEIGLLDAVKGTQGTAASRGVVAKLTDNALEIPMMVQVGFGDAAKWVVSGSKEHGDDAVYLLDAMGFDVVEGRVTAYDADDLEITIDKKDYEVAEGFDFYAVEGLEIKAWVDGDEVIVYTAKDEAKFDATTTDGAKLKLVGAAKSYAIARDAYLELDGEEVDEAFVADYAKVVLNEKDEVVYAEGYTLDFIVVEEIDDELITSYNSDELDLEDFLLVEAGKTITVEDLEADDVVFYNESEEFAVVYNNSKTGEIERVYSDSFRFGGKVYTVNADALYLDEDVMGSLVVAELDAMMDEEAEIEVFFAFDGTVVLVVGDRGVAKTSSFYAVLDKDAVVFDGRRGEMLALDLVDQNGKAVSYDLTEAFVKDNAKFVNAPITNTDVALTLAINTGKLLDANNDEVLKVTVNEDGAVTKVEYLTLVALADKSATAGYAFKVDDSYAKIGGVDYRLQDSTVIFYDLTATSKKAIKLADVKDEFTLIDTGYALTTSTGRIAAVIATATDADDDTVNETDLVTRVRRVTNNALEFTFANGERFTTAATNYTDADLTAAKAAYEKNVVKLVVGNKTGKVDSYSIPTNAEVTIATNGIDRTANTINATYELTSDAIVYDVTGSSATTIRLRDLVAGDTVEVYFVGTSNRFVNYVVRTAKVGTTAPVTGEYKLTWTAATGVLKADLKSNDTYTDFGILIGENVFTLNSSKEVSVTANSPAAKILTAKLVKLTAPTTVLAEVTFVR